MGTVPGKGTAPLHPTTSEMVLFPLCVCTAPTGQRCKDFILCSTFLSPGHGETPQQLKMPRHRATSRTIPTTKMAFPVASISGQF
jgi:hypothetical protein